MTSSMVSNPVVNSDRSSSIRRKKKKKIQSQSQSQSIGKSLDSSGNFSHNSSVQWKSDAQQQIYSSKLLQALRQVQPRDSSGQESTPKRSRAFREAADRALATTAKGRSRWSRAMLTNRLKLKFLKKNNMSKQQRKLVVLTTGNGRSQRKSKVSVVGLKSKSLPAVQRKARFLSRLVPGCRKQSLPVVLEEVIDYIPALEMQVRAMSALAELLSAQGSSALGGTAVNNFGSSRPPTTY